MVTVNLLQRDLEKRNASTLFGGQFKTHGHMSIYVVKYFLDLILYV